MLVHSGLRQLRLRGRALLVLQQQAQMRASRAAGTHAKEDDWPIKLQIGKREVVGFGNNGEENYIDDVHFPFPAIRFKEDTGEIIVSSYTTIQQGATISAFS